MDDKKALIEAWFSNPSYDAGVKLYEMFGRSKILLKNLTRSRTPIMAQTLAFELCMLGELPESMLDGLKVDVREEGELVSFSFTPLRVSEYREEIKHLVKQRNSHGYERSKLANKLREIPTTNTKKYMEERRLLLAKINAESEAYAKLDEEIARLAKGGENSTLSAEGAKKDTVQDTPPATTGNKYIDRCAAKSKVEIASYLPSLRSLRSKVSNELAKLADSDKKAEKEEALELINQALSYCADRLKGDS